MLILGRRADQSIVFPTCGIVVKILAVNGRVSKIGIEAPECVTILRGEVASQSSYTAVQPTSNQYADSADQFAETIEQLRQGLSRVQLLRKDGLTNDADRLFESILFQLNAMDRSTSMESGVAEAAISYRSATTSPDARILFVGHVQAAFEDDLRIIEKQLGKLQCIQSVDLALSMNQIAGVDCIILDIDQCANVEVVLRSLQSFGSDRPVKVICVSKFTPSLYGLPIDGSLFDGWILQPWDYVTMLSHIQHIRDSSLADAHSSLPFQSSWGSGTIDGDS